jgi:hypothetical protein
LTGRSERKVSELSADLKAPHRAIRCIDRRHLLSLLLTMKKTYTREKKKQDNQANRSHHRIPFLVTALRWNNGFKGTILQNSSGEFSVMLQSTGLQEE